MDVILVSIDAALLTAIAVIWFLVAGLRQDRSNAQKEAAELRHLVESIRSEVAHLKAKPADVTPPQPVTSTPSAALNTERRAEALEMLRYGADAGTVSATLRLSPAEATLLGKVQSLLAPAGSPTR